MFTTEDIARTCHEVNRVYCESMHDYSQGPWETAEAWQRTSAIEGVKKALEGQTPEQLHQSWCDFKLNDGWKYGAVKDAGAKTHPCLVPYDELPPGQRVKDHLFAAVVAALKPALTALVLILALLAPTSAHAQVLSSDHLFHASEGFAIIGHAADLGATEHCLGAQTCRELNPALARFQNPVAFSVAKFSVVALQLWAMRQLKDAGHPRWATVANVAIGSGFLALGIRNDRLTR